MNCREFKNHLDEMLIAQPGRETLEQMAMHAATCGQCAQDYAATREVLAALRFSYIIQPSTNLKERIMNRVLEVDSPAFIAKSTYSNSKSNSGFIRMAWVAAVAAVVIAAVWLTNGPGKKNGADSVAGFTLLAQARAAETALFTAKSIVYMLNEILVQPVSDPTLTEARWLPIISMGANGKPQFSQLALPAKPGESYTLNDRCWYDPSTGHFIRIISIRDIPVFATSFDGSAVYALDEDSTGVTQVVRTAITGNFVPPKNPSEILGLGAGITSRLNENDQNLLFSVEKVISPDGTPAHLVKVAFGGTETPTKDSYTAFTIRDHDSLITQVEWVIKSKSWLINRRVSSGTVDTVPAAWDLSDLQKISNAGMKKPAGIKVRPEMVKPDVSLAQMVEKADFAPYVFSSDPTWTGPRQITDMLDVTSPPHRMFMLSFCAKDGRHVVLVQSYTYNKAFGPMAKTGQLVYQSPQGVKVWSGPKDKWLANIILQSARGFIKDVPVENRTGYLIETPHGTFPALAINGTLSDQELHNLIDNLVPAKDCIK